jgi:hypothetical protein
MIMTYELTDRIQRKIIILKNYTYKIQFLEEKGYTYDDNLMIILMNDDNFDE